MGALSYAAWRRHGPLAAGGLGLAAAAGVAAYKAPDPVRAGLGLAYLGLLVLMAVYDLRTLRVPNRLVFPAMGFTLGTAALLGPTAAFQALGGWLLAGVILLGVAVAGRGAMGFGDVKVGAVCGAVVGLGGVVPMLAATFVAGGALAAVLLVLRVRRPKDVVAFTPFLVGATIFALAYYPLYLWG
jgi:Flp pilus assembly protein protease CpaA